MYVLMLFAILLIALLSYLETVFIGSAILTVFFVIISGFAGIIVGCSFVWANIFKNSSIEECEKLQEKIFGKDHKKKK